MDSISQEIVCQAYARTGLLGNPSDQFEGKSIALCISNYYAEVKLATSEDLIFVPHLIHDPLKFDSLEALNSQTNSCGFYGGVRLLKAICVEFYHYCVSNDIRLEKKNFQMSYDTNIPRQLGLAGSSAIITAGLSCLLRFYGVKSAIPVSQRPGIILKAETTLGITAGLQDQVIQVHGGLLFMDFNPEYLAARGRGSYTTLPVELLPPFILLTSNEPHDSTAAFGEVKQRWITGDTSIKEVVHQIAEIAEKGREALLDKDYVAFGKLMDENFKLWRKVYGDAAVGSKTVRMVELAKSIGAHANSTGSGGAVLVLCPKGDMQVYSLKDICKKEGIQVEKVDPAPKLFEPSS